MSNMLEAGTQFPAVPVDNYKYVDGLTKEDVYNNYKNKDYYILYNNLITSVKPTNSKYIFKLYEVHKNAPAYRGYCPEGIFYKDFYTFILDEIIE